MPYVNQGRRKVLDPLLKPLAEHISSRGDLNYAITALVSSQVTQVGYAALEQAVGVLEAAKLEFYRRVAAPYEDEKKRENGDVYFEDMGDYVSLNSEPAGPPPAGKGKPGKSAHDHRTKEASAVAP